MPRNLSIGGETGPFNHAVNRRSSTVAAITGIARASWPLSPDARAVPEGAPIANFSRSGLSPFDASATFARVACKRDLIRGQSALRDYPFAKDFLRFEFEAAAARSSELDVSSALLRLSASVGAVPGALIDAFEDLIDVTDSESETYLIYQVGRSWRPRDATEYIETLIARRTGVR